tara:strand:- start:3190 stop:3615 length:426 start_codon:yes stop_codon:yes gene_type:complete
MNLTNFYKKLPEELCVHIKSYIPLHIIFLTNKTDYINYKTEIITSLGHFNLTKHYVTKLIKKDYDFIFKIILDLKYKMWYKAWKIRYKGNILPCFIELLNYICIENKSDRCRKLIQDKMKEKGIRKNKHKRIRICNNTWSN